MEHFFGDISDAFTYFGETTRNAKSDNMKQWIRKHNRFKSTRKVTIPAAPSRSFRKNK